MEEKYIDLSNYTGKQAGDQITETTWNGVFQEIEDKVNALSTNSGSGGQGVVDS